MVLVSAYVFTIIFKKSNMNKEEQILQHRKRNHERDLERIKRLYLMDDILLKTIIIRHGAKQV